MSQTAKDYVAGEPVYHYPGAGDPKPPTGAKVLLLTIGGICITGVWKDNGGFMAWAPMPCRNKEKEALL